MVHGPTLCAGVSLGMSSAFLCPAVDVPAWMTAPTPESMGVPPLGGYPVLPYIPSTLAHPPRMCVRAVKKLAPIPRDSLRMGMPSKGRMAEDTIQLLKVKNLKERDSNCSGLPSHQKMQQHP
jgi:hypothetical protein